MLRKLALLMAAVMLLPTMAFSDLHDPNNAADYLIVTTQELIDTYPWIDQLAQWRNAHVRTAMVVATEDVWNEFGAGVPSDTVLKTFFHYAYENWQEPQLRDVFIIGFHDIVPSHVAVSGTESYLSDYYYVTAMDSAFTEPYFAIGRLPWSPISSPDLWDYYSKLIGYEAAATAPWQTRVHLMVDSNSIFPFDTAMVEALLSQVQAGYEIERDFVGFPPGHPWHGSFEEIMANLDSGSYLAQFLGHVDGNEWGIGMQIDSTDLMTLTNATRLPIMSGMELDISANDFVLGGIPAALLMNPNGGTIAYIAQTWVVYSSFMFQYKSALFRLATSDSMQTLGDLWRMTHAEVGDFTMSRSNMLLGDPGLVLPPRPTAIDDPTPELPQSIRLLGNYPNPFNVSTVIRFELDRALNVSLKVYDVLGREAASLANEPRAAGTYSVIWDASRAASGVYFAVLQAGDVRQAMKMMLLK